MVGGSGMGIGGVQLADGGQSSSSGAGPLGFFASLDGVATGVTRLNSFDASTFIDPATEVVVWVETVQDFYRLDRSSVLPVDATNVVAAFGLAGAQWLRMHVQNPTWQARLAWFIDPTSGNDEADGGTSGTALKSVREYRNRVVGVQYVGSPTITFITGSVVLDDGNFTGINAAPGFSVAIILQGTPVPIGAVGTFTGVTVIAGNGRYLVTDTGIPVSWSANTWVSTAAVPRMIRNVAKTKHAWVLTDQGGKTASLSQPVDTSETAGFSTNNSDFTIGESYEVCSIPSIPTLAVNGAGSLTVQLRCLGIGDGQISSGGTLLAALAAFGTEAWTVEGTTRGLFACFVGGTSQSFFGITTLRKCAVMGAAITIIENANMPSTEWYLQGGSIVVNGGRGNLGTFHAWDCTAVVLTCRYGGSVEIQGLVGLGNTGKLLSANRAVIYGGALATAVTSDVTPFVLNTLAGATLPVVDQTAGGAIYS